MTNQRNSQKQWIALLAILCIGAPLPVLYVHGAQVAHPETRENDEIRAPVFGLAFCWECLCIFV